MNKLIQLIVLLLVLMLLVISDNRFAHASVELNDGKLRLNGFVKETVYLRTSWPHREQEDHDNRFDYITTSALFEALYTAYETDDTTIRLFGGLKAWWDKSLKFDDEMSRSMSSYDRKHYQSPRKFEEDCLTEAYIEYSKGPFQLRTGKQIVIWGQLDMQRVADVVNPLDLRKGVPGIDTWEEIKQGLWIIRAFYQTSLPGDLLFEAIFNPGDFRDMKLPYEGTHYGTPVYKSNPFDIDYGNFHWMQRKWAKDAPGWNTHNYEYGFKVRGSVYDLDWTLFYYNSLNDTPVAHPGRVGAFQTEYFFNGAVLGKVPDNWPAEKVFYYKRSQNVGGTFQTFLPQLWNTVWRTEWAYQIGVPMNKGTDGATKDLYGWTRRDVMSAAIAVSKHINIPGFTQSRFATGRQLSVTITYAWDKVSNWDHDLILNSSNHAKDHSANDQISLFLQQEFFHSTIFFTLTGFYHFHTKKMMAVPVISYMFPDNHTRLELGYAYFNGAKAEYVSNASASKDSVLFRLRYEF